MYNYLSKYPMTTLRTILVSSVLFLTIFFPTFVFAQGIVPCGIDTNNDGRIPSRAQEAGAQPPDVQCEFADFIELIQRFLNYLIYVVATPIAAIMFAIAGYMYLTAGEDTGKVKKAHDIFISVLMGFGVMLIAWALVSFVLNTFTDGRTYNLLDAPTTPPPF